MQRRRFLQGLGALGLVGSLPGCQPPSRPHLRAQIQGRILGSNHQQGHKIRDGKLPNEANTPLVRTQVAILGGGVAGLSAARRLHREGLDDFLLFELENQLGGNSRSQVYPESAAPWAAHYLPIPTKESVHVQEILSEMGILKGFQPDGTPIYQEDALCHAPTERLWHLGGWQEGLFPKDTANEGELKQLAAFHKEVDFWKKFRDKEGKKAFSIPLDLSSRDPQVTQLDQITMLDWLKQKGWDSPGLHFYLEYATRDDYGSALDNTSAWAGLHYFAARDGGGFSPNDAQFVWPEGNQRLTAHLLQGIEDRCRSAHMITKLDQQNNGDWHISVFDIEQGRSIRVEAKKVVWALPQFLRPYLLSGSWEKSWTEQFVYSPWVVANLVLSSLPAELPAQHPGLCWDNVISDSPSLGYVVATHQSLSVRPHPTVLTWYRPFKETDTRASRKLILEKRWEDWADEVLSELIPLHPGIEQLVRRLDVMLLGHAMIRPSVGFITGPSRRAARQAFQGVHFAHSDLSGISIFEEANAQGERAAAEILASQKSPASSTQEGSRLHEMKGSA